MLKFAEATGKTVDAAAAAARRELGISEDEGSMEILDLPKAGFLGLGARPARVKVSVELPDEEPKLLLSYEYRYPVGRFLLSPVAGLLDPEDAETDDPLRTGAIREIFEETGVRMAETDTLTVLNPCAFSSPGMTDESNAFLRADITVENTEMLSQSGAVGSELFNGFELVTKEEARKLFRTGRDRFGNTFSLATWVILADFVMES